MLNLTYEYKIQPTKQQVTEFETWLETCRQVYNYALAERKDWINSRKSRIDACSLQKEYIIPPDTPYPSYVVQCASLTKAKEKNPNLKLVQSQVLQQTLNILDKAFASMKENGFGFPRFKKKGQMRSFLFPTLGKNPIKGNRIKLPKIGEVKMRLSRPIPEGFNLKQARVLKRASGWYVFLIVQADVNVPNAMPNGNAIGLDLGLLSFVATSLGELIHRLKFYVDAQRQLKLLQQQLKRKTKGSRNWNKHQRRVAKHHEYISNCRKDFHFKVAHHLCDQADTIFAEDLNLKALAKGMLCKHTLDAGWSQFLSILNWVCWKRSKHFSKVDAKGTSQTCPQCNTHTGKKELSERVHLCPNCGYQTDRDVAAAQVVLNRGYTATGLVAVKLDEATSEEELLIQESLSL